LLLARCFSVVLILSNHFFLQQTPFDTPIEEIYDGILDGPVLGTGVSGVVKVVIHRATGVKYAVKCLDLSLITSTEGLLQLRTEIDIMCQLDHPNIVRIREVYESTSAIYIVQELCLGGDLFDRLDQQPNFHYTEKQCAKLVKQVSSDGRLNGFCSKAKRNLTFCACLLPFSVLRVDVVIRQVSGLLC
jgi:serine/threonine protein kinase